MTATSSPAVNQNTATAPAARAIPGLPADFRWGVATSAYQIEGATDTDGRTPSIWDTFCRVPGAVERGENGDTACEHYRRMPEDVAMIAGLGVDTYRFSVSWSRVQPHGSGPVNPAGIGFYDRLVDELLERGVTPWLTLYHWDLPQELEDAGGWPARDTAYRFADYAEATHAALGDRVRHWTTLNEPWCSAWLGYHTGEHAPGRKDFGDSMHAVHHLLLGHGLAAQRLREAGGADLELGITLNLGHSTPATDDPEDVRAARSADGMGSRLYLDPLVHGRYPEDVVAELGDRGVTLPVQDGDLETISAPLDVLGVNYYSAHQYSGTAEDGSTTDAEGRPVVRGVPHGRPRTAMGWEIVPEGLTRLLVRLEREYGVPTVITENGAAFDDELAEDGTVPDTDRVAYLDGHIRAVADARAEGADVRGYFAWSLMDNFEWAFGYQKRFGIVHVDYETQQRTVKDSGLWYRDTIRHTRGG
ncbi:GH1 family beta-glucosidase [Streptomyces otsuchiensis]|uniref:GH1 family beta-glucosidase n=1 Tax=Streptomyces otsuchiensis TaxID=2681388 RepID=UPI00102FB2E5|nr:GH1 family beta-glucosidase [Streptomyces otsuchiensis]